MATESHRPDIGRDGRVVPIIVVDHAIEMPIAKSPEFEIHSCTDLSEATRFWAGSDVSVVLVELDRVNDSDRERLLKQMAQFSTVLVLAVARSIDDKSCESLLRMGFVGSLRGSDSAENILKAAKAVIAGELWFPRATLSRVLRGFLMAQDPNQLTAREREILGLIGSELNNQQIGDRLFISRETVRWHIKSLHGKLGISSRRGLRDHIRLLNRIGKMIPVQREASKISTSKRVTTLTVA